jgi:hypothetical protein
VSPVERHIIGFDARWVTFARSGSIKTRDKADVGNDEVAAWLAKGRNVVAHLPPSWTRADRIACTMVDYLLNALASRSAIASRQRRPISTFDPIGLPMMPLAVTDLIPLAHIALSCCSDSGPT